MVFDQQDYIHFSRTLTVKHGEAGYVSEDRFCFSKGDGTGHTHSTLPPHICLKVNTEDSKMSEGQQ